MARGIDITLGGSGERRRLQVGGVPYELLQELMEQRFEAAPVIVSPEDDAVLRKVPCTGGPEGWSRVPPGEGIELGDRWSRLDAYLLGEEPGEGTPEAAAAVPSGPASMPGCLMRLQSEDGGAFFTVEAESGFLRDLLRRVLAGALEAGGEAASPVEIPEEVLDRVWNEAARGLHLNPNRKILRGEELVLTGNLGGEFHLRRRGRGTVRIFRLILPRRGPLRWEGPEEVPARTYVREHLDDWPGRRGVFIVAAAALLILVLILLRPLLLRLFRGD